MRLLRYRVTNFRSVADSGWIDADDVTALIGVNESGKSNLLLPLWKLKPAREGEIRPTSDYPKTMFAEIRENPARFRFISAEFATDSLGPRIAKLAGIRPEEAEVVRVDRYYNGSYVFSFPDHEHATTASPEDVAAILQAATSEISGMPALAKEETQKVELISGLQSAALELPETPMSADALAALAKELRALARRRPRRPAASSLALRHSQPV